jgi:hypothetical protein
MALLPPSRGPRGIVVQIWKKSSKIAADSLENLSQHGSTLTVDKQQENGTAAEPACL